MKRPHIIIFVLIIFTCLFAIECKKKADKQKNPQHINEKANLSQAYFGGGCFWCVEAMFEDLKGVEDVESGYSGGFIENPQYKEVKKGKTGHAQVIKISYDSKIISFKELLHIFMHAHDPTTYHRQGIDSGPQYRSVVYYQTQEQLRTTLNLFKDLQKQGSYSGYPAQILTQVAYFGKYYPAEAYHQNYFTQNPFDQQCSSIIAPKVQKIKKLFKKYFESQEL